MSENNRPKSPSEILEGLSHQANKMALLAKEIDEKIYAFYSVQKKFIENGNVITAEQNKILNELKNYKAPEISLDPYAKKQMEELKQYEKISARRDKALWYVLFIFIIQVAVGLYYFNYSVKTKREFKKEFEDDLLKNGKIITGEENYNNLDFNTKMIYEWIDKNPEDSKSFKRFLKNREQEKN